MISTRLILIRHGQMEWNRVERFRGRADPALTEVGVKQAQAMAERIARWRVSAVYSSPLRRALETAYPIAKRFGLEVEILPGVIDIDYGEWQGLSMEEAETMDGVLYAKWREKPQEVEFPCGESLDKVRERAVAVVSELINKYQGQVVAVVSHKVVCQLLILEVLKLDNSHFWQIAQDVCALNLFEYRDGAASALIINETCHVRHL